MSYPWQDVPDQAKRLGLVEDQTPPSFTWGCRSSADFVLSAQAMVLWFSGPSEAVRLFAEGEPMDSESLKTSEARESLRRELNALADESDRTPATPDELRDALQPLLTNWIAIEWLGTFDELCRGDTEMARETRNEYREYETDEGSDEPIQPSEEATFVEFLNGDWRTR
jgi:hypothetical protein